MESFLQSPRGNMPTSSLDLTGAEELDGSHDCNIGQVVFCVPVPIRTAVSQLSSPPRPRYAERGDWELHENVITELYQNNPLRKVMEIMEQVHGFRATEKMWKMHIRKWGLDKKNKAPEVLEMFRLTRQRAAVGKASEFILRGRLVDWTDVDRYVKRNRTLTAKINLGFLEIGGKTAGLICRTPSPDPAVSFSVPGVMQLSDELHQVDEVVRVMRDYYRGATESRMWLFTADNSGLRKYRGTDSAWSQLLETELAIYRSAKIRDFKAAVELINSMLDEVSGYLSQQDIGWIFKLLDMVFNCIYASDVPEIIAESVSRHIQALVEVVLGRCHPLAILWRRVAAVPGQCRLDLLLKMEESFLECMGPMNHNCGLAIWVYWLYIRHMNLHGDKCSLQRQSLALQAFITGDHTDRTTCRAVWFLLNVSDHLFGLGAFAEVDAALQLIAGVLSRELDISRDFQVRLQDKYNQIMRGMINSDLLNRLMN